MKAPLSWLAEYAPLRGSPDEIAHRLTMQGIETAYLPGPASGWDGVVVGRVVELEPHPNADRLRLATVDIGADAKQVVCGAPNVAVGQRIAFASVGAELVNGHTGERMTLAAATIRGVRSEGMVCSERELGLSDDHEGILVLPDDAPIGAALADCIAAGDTFEVEVTANRGDCLSMLGVAREIAAGSGERVTEPSIAYDEAPTPNPVRVEIRDAELCARYTATVIRGVRIAPSPAWLRQRLEAAGQRPINNVVDVTNYVMLEYGQPLHAFDLARVRRQTIVVRQAAPGERLATLDGVERELAPPMLVIADPERAVALAGVMGGANSEVSDATTDILLESATFNAINTRRTAAALRVRTEASTRFEKGLHPDLAERALRRATALIAQAAGGVPDAGIADAYPGRAAPRTAPLASAKLSGLLGMEISDETIAEALASLGFEAERQAPGVFSVTAPYWRTDVAIEEDLIEEVARIVGYDAVPAIPLGGRVPSHPPQTERDVREEARDLLAAAGLHETISPSLTAAPAGAPALRVLNPMSREQEALRTSMRPGVLRALSAGLRHANGALGLFEVGKVYLPRGNDLPDERETAVFTAAQARGGALWDGALAPRDFYYAKGIVQSLLANLGLTPAFEACADPLLHPGRAASILLDGAPVGVIGELHPREAEVYDMAGQTVAFGELDIRALAQRTPWLRHAFRPFSRYPAADRDLALVVDRATPAAELHAIIAEHPLVSRASLFDAFEGGTLAPGKKSLAFRVELQSNERTLGPDEINDAMAAITQQLAARAGATLRG